MKVGGGVERRGERTEEKRVPGVPGVTCTGMAHRLGHRKKNHISWLVSMATRLQI